jgi:hypothetical protein
MLTTEDLMDIEMVLNRSAPPKGRNSHHTILIAEEHLRCLELLRKEIERRMSDGED